MNSQGNYGSGACWQPKYGNIKLKEFLFQTLLFTVFPGKNMVPLMSSLPMSFQIFHLFRTLARR